MVDIDVGSASAVGGRSSNADALAVAEHRLGVGAAVVDGIGGSELVCAASQAAATAAAWTAAGAGAQVGLMAATQVMPAGCGANAVAAVASVIGDRVEVAHCGDAAAWTWSPETGLTRWGLAQNVGQHIRHLLNGTTLTEQGRARLAETRIPAAMDVLDSLVLSGLNYASLPTISWTTLRAEHAHPEVIILTSDGVHDAIRDDEAVADLLAEHAGGPAQHLAEALVQGGFTAPRTDPDGVVDNTSSVVLTLDWEA